MFDTKEAFAAIRGERCTESGRAAVDLAESLFAASPTESRLWLARSLDFDKTIADVELQKALDRLRLKAGTREKADRAAEVAKQASGSNVLQMRAGEDRI